MDRIAAHAIGQPLAAEIRNIYALPGAVVSPTVIAASQSVAGNRPQMQRNLPVRAPVLQRKHTSACPAIKYNRVAREPNAARRSSFQVVGPRDGIPVIRMCSDAAQVSALIRKRAARSRHTGSLVTAVYQRFAAICHQAAVAFRRSERRNCLIHTDLIAVGWPSGHDAA
jgi:hypothetical protein